MNCAYHYDREVRGICSSCGRPICEDCLVDLNGQPFCKNCLISRVQRPSREINGFIRFVLSICPGIGHLYMGLFNRGMQFLLGAVIGGVILGMIFPGFLGLYVPAVIFFSIFDAREVHMRLAQGLEVEDKGFVDLKAMPLEWNQKYIGYGLLGIGILGVYRVLLDDILGIFFDYRLRDAVNGLTLGVVAIAVGVWLLKRDGQRSQ